MQFRFKDSTRTADLCTEMAPERAGTEKNAHRIALLLLFPPGSSHNEANGKKNLGDREQELRDRIASHRESGVTGTPLTRNFSSRTPLLGAVPKKPWTDRRSQRCMVAGQVRKVKRSETRIGGPTARDRDCCSVGTSRALNHRVGWTLRWWWESQLVTIDLFAPVTDHNHLIPTPYGGLGLLWPSYLCASVPSIGTVKEYN